MATVFIQKDKSLAPVVRLTNDTGAALEQNELTVIGGLVVVANDAIASTAIGAFSIVEDLSFQIADFVDSEDTFATENAVVYWDPTSGDFSDTSTATYYPVGIVQVAKTSGVVLVYGERNTAVVGA